MLCQVLKKEFQAQRKILNELFDLWSSKFFIFHYFNIGFIFFYRFIGKHETHFKSFEDAKQLYFASRKYQIQDLESRCLKYITSTANYSNVCQIFEFAQAVSDTELLATCTNIIAWDVRQVVESEDFLCSKVSTLKFIYTMDDLIIDSEIELFKALEKWIQLHIQIVSTGKHQHNTHMT